ncbi:MAG: winged helix-turn-helix domain-containing protein [Promethearchaeota archaeon]
MSQNGDTIDYKIEILECIKENPGGLTITDISEITGFTRNTIYKYIKDLKENNLVFTKKVGPYKQYFSTRKFHLPYDTAISYYKAILKNIKNFIGKLGELTLNEQKTIVKAMGKNTVKDIKFPFAANTMNQLRELKHVKLNRLHLQAFQQFYTAYDIFQPDIVITIKELDEKNQYAVYRFHNSIFLEDSEDYIYHIYLMIGITEGILENALEREVNVKVKEIYIGSSKEDSYFDIEIQIGIP